MMESRLQNLLDALAETLRRTRLRQRLAISWASAAVACFLLLLLDWTTGLGWLRLWPAAPAGGILAAIVIWLRESRSSPDLHAVAAALERGHPELRHLVSAAAEQQPDPGSGSFQFLQMRVIDEVVMHRQKHLWRRQLHQQSISAAYLHTAALAGLAMVCLTAALSRHHLPTTPWLAREITVSPGDTEVERGTGLVIAARFGRKPPAEATLVLETLSGKVQRIPLERHLADPIFGASAPEIREDLRYHVEYQTSKTRDYRVRVFDYPALRRADAALQFPAYTGLTNKTIRDTLRVSAVEGSHLTYTLQLNKPVVQARLVGKPGTLNLTIRSNDVALLNDLLLTNSARYSLQLRDASGRTNKFASNFVIQVLTNRRPELKLTFPRGDQRVSPLQELQVQAEATDDFGLLHYGIGYGVAGQEPRLVELGGPAPATQKRQFGYVIPLEQLGVAVDQLISWFAWADDMGPNGEPRRTFTDMFFAEVRPFEQVFRPDQSGGGGENQQQAGGNQSTRLAEMEKEIVIATWKLHRDKPGAPGAASK